MYFADNKDKVLYDSIWITLIHISQYLLLLKTVSITQERSILFLKTVETVG